MGWTTPMTAVANSTFTAAQFNTHVRDNLLETAAAKATTLGGLFVAQGANTLVERVPAHDYVAGTETTGSTSYVELTTPSSVTVTTSTKAIIIVSGLIRTTTVDAICFMSFAIAGATTRAALDSYAVAQTSSTASARIRGSAVTLLDDLTSGSNQFKTAFKTTAGTLSAAERRIMVIPL